jgi:hypothetical protein
MTARAARGSLTGRWRARTDGRPNVKGILTLERDAPAGTTLHLAGWTREAGGAEFVSLSATVATRAAPGREPRAKDDEPEGRFVDPLCPVPIPVDKLDSR